PPDENDNNFKSGFQDISLLQDMLAICASEVEKWPRQLTEVERQYGCVDGAPVPPPESCGNNVQEDDEECDGNDLDNMSCTDFGFDGGNLGCRDSGPNACTFDFSDCELDSCGNGVIDQGEQCDMGHKTQNDNEITTGNPNSIEDFCSPTSCTWTPCEERFNNGVGTEGCECNGEELNTEGDVCVGDNDQDGMDLICRFGPNHTGKKCLRCPWNGGEYGQGVGCPCGPGDSCNTWGVFDEGPDVQACTEPILVCLGPAPLRGIIDLKSRCWDVFDVNGFNCEGQCQFGKQCFYGNCDFPDCVDGNFDPGICSAMNMICEPDFYGDPVCINTNQCRVPNIDPESMTSTCGGANSPANVVNNGQGVPNGEWCPGPYGF
ncbi:MAG: hypothetical protein K8I00_11515, partial [Candidatus Omnitrophica bacterium]|nr:hypothetical protein [Candidatus Omnitrophota bacterium]